MTCGAGTSTIAGISAMCQWLCFWCHVMPIPIVSHNQKHHVASQFSCLDLRTTVVLVMTPLTWCDISDGTDVVTWTKKSCFTSSQSSWPQKCNGTTRMPWASCNGGAKGIAWAKVLLHCNLIALTQWMLWCHWWCTLMMVTWCGHQCQLCSMAKKVMLQLILIVLT